MLLRRMLADCSPLVFASITGVEALPPIDYGVPQEESKSVPTEGYHIDDTILFFFPKDHVNRNLLYAGSFLYRVGILDVLLACIAKALTLQVKTKGRDKESSKNPISTVTIEGIFAGSQDCLGFRWWMRGSIPRRVAENVIQIVRDMASVRII